MITRYLCAGHWMNCGVDLSRDVKKEFQHVVFLRLLPGPDVWGGFEKRLLDYLKAIDFSRCRVTLVVNFDSFSARLRQEQLPVNVRLFPWLDAGAADSSLNSMARFLRSLCPDRVIFAQGAFGDFTLSDFLSAFWITKGKVYAMEALGAPRPEVKSSKKYFNLVPGVGFWWYRKMFSLSARGWLCKAVTTNSQEVRRRLVEWYRYPRGRSVTIYHGVDREKYVPSLVVKTRMRQSFNIPTGDKVVVSSARLSANKRLDRLIHAFGAIHDPRLWLFVIGDGPLRHDLEALARQKPNADKIHFLGFREHMAEFLQMADMFVLPSDNEGLSNAMLEAMAAGLVTVVTDVPGAREAIEPDRTGFVAEPTADGVREGLVKALSLSEKQSATMSLMAQECIREKFDRERGIKRTLQILRIPARETGNVSLLKI